jgi:hypothetical protein
MQSCYVHIGAGVAVAGADLDLSLLRCLRDGEQPDRIMVEVNGLRMGSNHKCPLVAEHPWIVDRNNPPSSGNREDNTLVICHPDFSEPFTLHYDNLISLPRKQPAVFEEQDLHSGGSLYVTVQFVSHYLPEYDIEKVFAPYDADGYERMLQDDVTRSYILEAWQKLFMTFKPGWRQKGISRLSLRAGVKQDTIHNITAGNFGLVSLSDTYGIHKALYWLAHYIELSQVVVG